MPPIQFAINSYQSRALPLSAQQVVNLFAEAAPQDAKSQVVLLNGPGIKSFCDNVGDGPIRGTEVMDGVLYALSGDVLYSVDAACKRIALGSIGVGAGSTSTLIAGAKVPATASFEITGGTSGSANTISSITVGGEELLGGSTAYDTDDETTAAALLTSVVSDTPPQMEDITGLNSTPEGSFAGISFSSSGLTSIGDLLIAQIGRNGVEASNIVADDDGWTPIFENAWDTRTNLCFDFGGSMSMFWRIADVDGAVSYSWTYDGTNSPHAIGFIATISGHHPIDPIQSSVVSFNSACNVGNFPNGRTLSWDRSTAATANTLSILTLCLAEAALGTGAPLTGFAKNGDFFRGPIPTSLQLQFFSRNIDLVAGVQPSVTHADLEPDIDNVDDNSIVVASLSISPRISGLLPSSPYGLTVDGATVTITAPDGTGAELNGLEVIITTTGDVTVACN